MEQPIRSPPDFPEKLATEECGDFGRPHKRRKEASRLPGLEGVNNGQPLDPCIDTTVVAPQGPMLGGRQGWDCAKLQVKVSKALKILLGVATTQRIRAHHGDITIRRHNQEPAPQGEALRVKRIVLAEPQPLFITQPMDIKEAAPHHRLEEAQLPTISAAPADITQNERLEAELTRFGPRSERYHRTGLGPSDLCLLDLQDIVGNKIGTLVASQQLSDPPRKEEIIRVEDRNPWGG
jgi:hypothetical protein